MKKFIFAEILLLFASAVLLYFAITRIDISINNFHNYEVAYAFQEFENAELYQKAGINSVILSCVSFLATFGNIFVIILIAIKDFPVFKPLVDKVNARKQALKEEKKQKELEGKQQQLEKLQAEIDNLKNN